MVEVRKVKENELESALELLFNDPNSSQTVRQQVDSFKQLAKRENYDLTRQFVVTEDAKVIYSCCYLANAGGSATVFSSNPGKLDSAQQIKAVRALRQLRRWAEHRGSNFLQIYLETDDKARRDIALRCGFKYLTNLKYLYYMNDTELPKVDVPQVQWVSYTEDNDQLFKQVMKATYVDSADCPELSKYRDMDQTLESHKAAGEFVPELWRLAYYQGQPVGVLLLSILKDGHTVELTYMGLERSWRGRGFGKAILLEALLTANRLGCYITLAVDKRNIPADKLYVGMGFKELFERAIVYYCTAD
ncbi:MAG: GNAT family N-acetyltransferase [Phycisphaerae bacterium]|nr:GNAT family N-acetyltransferase [Phycisphaerae bacterium]